MPEFVKVAKTGDIAPGEAKAVGVGARRIAIFNIEGTYHAIDDKCTHRGGPLSEGIVVGVGRFRPGEVMPFRSVRVIRSCEPGCCT